MPRKHHYGRQSRGSLDELPDRLTCALDANYSRQPEYVETQAPAISVAKRIYGYKRSVRFKKRDAEALQ